LDTHTTYVVPFCAVRERLLATNTVHVVLLTFELEVGSDSLITGAVPPGVNPNPPPVITLPAGQVSVSWAELPAFTLCALLASE
jgi:hypothetical protein